MEQETQLGVKTVLFGQPYRDGNGADQIAGEDIVILTTLIDGTPRHQVQMTAGQAMAIGQMLADGAGKIVNAEVGDDGKPTGFFHRLARLNAKATS